jgi:hypothetical protein
VHLLVTLEGPGGVGVRERLKGWSVKHKCSEEGNVPDRDFVHVLFMIRGL